MKMIATSMLLVQIATVHTVVPVDLVLRATANYARVSNIKLFICFLMCNLIFNIRCNVLSRVYTKFIIRLDISHRNVTKDNEFIS